MNYGGTAALVESPLLTLRGIYVSLHVNIMLVKTNGLTTLKSHTPAIEQTSHRPQQGKLSIK